MEFFKHSFFSQVGKYGIIGIMNTLLHAGIFNFLIWITDIAKGFFVILFFLIAFVITVTHSFFWNKFWTFKAGGTAKSKKEYTRFFVITSVVSLIYAGLMHVLINVIGAPAGISDKFWANISFVILIPGAFLGNFFGYRIIVFKKNNENIISNT